MSRYLRSTDRKEDKAMARDDGGGDLVDRLQEDWTRERPELDVSAMAVVGRLLHLGRALEARANAALKSVGLAYTDFDVLATLRRAGEPFRLTPTALRRSVVLTSGAMTACLNRLEAQGLLTREPDAEDGRVLTARLTPQGRALVDRAAALRFQEAAEALKGLTPRQAEDLSNLLRTLNLSLGR
jgi:DNA-binding MarR family transcriptional regulator